MKTISFLICFVLSAHAYANVSTSSGPTLDTQAPGYFAGLIGRSDYVVVPVYDSKSKSMGEPVVIRDRAKLDRLAEILGRAVYKTTGHVFAVLAGGPITFYAKDKQRVLTLEKFGRIVRLNGQDYELDTQSAREISEWLKKPEANQSVQPTPGS